MIAKHARRGIVFLRSGAPDTVWHLSVLGAADCWRGGLRRYRSDLRDNLISRGLFDGVRLRLQALWMIEYSVMVAPMGREATCTFVALSSAPLFVSIHTSNPPPLVISPQEPFRHIDIACVDRHRSSWVVVVLGGCCRPTAPQRMRVRTGR